MQKHGQDGDLQGTYLHYDRLIGDAAHHLVDGLEELQQRLPEVCFSFVFIKPEE